MTTTTQSVAGEQQAVLLRVLFIPLEEGGLLVPNTAVAEVIESDPQMELAETGAPDWLIGRLIWRGLAVPTIGFEALTLTGGKPGRGARRVVVLNTLNGNQALPFVAMAMSGLPRLIQVAEGTVRAVDVSERADGILRYVRVGELNAIIPDLDWIEKRLMDGGIVM